MEACRHLKRQTHQDYEVCISDDCSTDDRSEELRQLLRELQITFVYRRQEKNSGYDANLRAAIALASGEYCLLMGNDDCLAEDTTLEELRAVLEAHPRTGVVITNYKNFTSGEITRRVGRTGNYGGGPEIAVRHFRDFSLVSGVLLRRARAQALATNGWDGSEMYQMYIGCRIIAEGHELLELDMVAVRKDIAVPGESVDSYANRPRIDPCAIVERKVPGSRVGSLVCDAIGLYAGKRLNWYRILVFFQILFFTYPYWILECRRVQSWKYAVGICLGMRPKNLFREVHLPLIHRWLLRSAFAFITCTALLMPISLFFACRPKLYAIAKSAFRHV